MSKTKTKQEKRELIANKLKAKQKLGATLSSQFKRIQTTKKYKGHIKKY